MNSGQPTTLQEAIIFLQRSIEPISRMRTVSVAEASGQVLAEELRAPAPLPRFDNAAMDGYAVNEADLGENGAAILRLAETVAAGQAALSALAMGSAVRVATGAPVPAGATRVVMQEDASADEDLVKLDARIGGKSHIRWTGEDLAKGDLAIEAGTKINAGHIALLVALGMQTIAVRASPRVAVLSTGNELTDVYHPLSAAQIYDSNRPMLLQMAKAAGAIVSDLGIAKDNPDEILERLLAASASHDLLITSGGASKGFADHLCSTIARHGRLAFWNLGMRPGKPIGFGYIENCPVLVLPGNPVAAAGGFALVGRAAIGGLRGAVQHSYVYRLPVAGALSKATGKTHLVMARVRGDKETGNACVEPLQQQSSASLRSLANSEVFIVLGPDESEIPSGTLVDVVPIWHSA